MDKIIIVEGKTDKERLELVLDEPVKILCSFGTLDVEKLEEWIEQYQNDELYILTDADEAGNKLRHQIQRELPNVHHLYTQKMYREVATTPLDYLTSVLERAHFAVKEIREE